MGENDASGEITESSSTEGVSAGGLVGANSGSIASSSATGSVGGIALTAGGLVGTNYGSITASSSTSGTVAGGYFTGGLVSYNSGTISGSTASPGALAVNSTYASQAVETDLGGLVGINDTSGQISGSSVSGAGLSASAFEVVIGGSNAGTISDTYNTGEVFCVAAAGGLVGIDRGAISTSWPSGRVFGSGYAGGLIGQVGPLGVTVTLEDLYWDEGGTRQTSAIGGNFGTVDQTSVVGIGGTTGLSPTAQSTYAGFNFASIWTINSGVSPPTLQVFGP